MNCRLWFGSTVHILHFGYSTVAPTVGNRIFPFCTVGLDLADSSHSAFWQFNCRTYSRKQDFSLLYCWLWFWSTVHILHFDNSTAKVTKNDRTETKKYFPYCRLKRWFLWTGSSKRKKHLRYCSFCWFFIAWWQSYPTKLVPANVIWAGKRSEPAVARIIPGFSTVTAK